MADTEMGEASKPSQERSTQQWVEKYRPRKVDDVSHQGEVVSALQRSMATGNLPHLLFYGGPGTGKTTTALAVARQMYGPELIRARVLELNASDQRGIGVVRSKIKAFASQAVGAPAPGYPSPPYKLLILDEADSMTEDAQNALRRTMEAYSRVTRFVFICNYVSRIIGPIASRCAKFRFQPVAGESAAARLRYIAGEEGVGVDDAAVAKILEVSGGDLRKAINTLQSAARLNHGAGVTAEAVVRACGQVDGAVAQALIDKVRGKSFDDLHKQCEDTVADGHSVLQVLEQLQALALADEGMPEAHCGAICVRLATAEKRLLDGADEFLQLLDACSYAQRTLQGLTQSAMPFADV